MSEKLKPCPFCGGEPIVVRYDGVGCDDRFVVQCEYTRGEKGCGAEGQHNKIHSVAIALWNNRVNLEPKPKNFTIAVAEIVRRLPDLAKECPENAATVIENILKA